MSGRVTLTRGDNKISEMFVASYRYIGCMVQDKLYSTLQVQMYIVLITRTCDKAEGFALQSLILSSTCTEPVVFLVYCK